MSASMPSSPPLIEPATAPRGWHKLTRLIEPIVLLLPSGVWLLLLLVVPTLLILELSLIPGFRLGQPVGAYGIGNYVEIFRPIYFQVILRSILFAVVCTIICMGLGFPVAYWIAVMAPPRWRNLLLVSFVLPLWTSSLLRAYAWITILRPSGILNNLLSALHLPNQAWLNQTPAVYIGMAYSFLPYMVLILYASLEKLDKRLLEAASDLGATPQQTFWKVTVPQTLPGIAAGGLLVFITSLGEFVVPELLGGASSMTVSRLIYNQFLGVTRNWGLGSSFSILMITGVSIAIALLLKYGDRESTFS